VAFTHHPGRSGSARHRLQVRRSLIRWLSTGPRKADSSGSLGGLIDIEARDTLSFDELQSGDERTGTYSRPPKNGGARSIKRGTIKHSVHRTTKHILDGSCAHSHRVNAKKELTADRPILKRAGLFGLHDPSRAYPPCWSGDVASKFVQGARINISITSLRMQPLPVWAIGLTQRDGRHSHSLLLLCFTTAARRLIQEISCGPSLATGADEMGP